MNKKIDKIIEDVKFKKKKLIKTAVKLMIAAVIAIGIAGVAFYAYVKSNINYSRSEAEEIALMNINGQVVGYGIDLEDGILEYEFKIKDGNNKLYEVKVDSKYGAITESDHHD